MKRSIFSAFIVVLYFTAVLMPVASVNAVSVNKVMTPPSGWSTPTGPVMTIVDAGGEASSLTHTDTSVALRNAPSTTFNPGLNALILAGGTDNTVHEAGAFPIVSDVTTCPDDTPVTVLIGPSTTTTLDMTGTIPSPGDNNSSHALFDLSGPSTPYLSVSDNANIGDVFNHPGGSYATTFGNLENLFVIANAEVVEAAITDAPTGSESSSLESIPSVTLSYDNANCPISPTAENTAVSETIVSSDTARGLVVVDGSRYGASDENDDTLTYSITAGNGAGYFAIDSATGDISTTRANVPVGTYVLTVLIDDGNGGTVEATVTITVTESGLADTGDGRYLLTLSSVLTIALGVALAFRMKLPKKVY